MTVKGQETETDSFDVVTSEADDIGIGTTEKPIDPGSPKKEEESPEAPAKGEEAKKEEDDKGEKEKADAAGDTGAEKKRAPGRFQKRIDRKVKQAAAAEKRADEAEKRAEAAEKKLADSGKADDVGTEKPEPSDYDNYDDYLKALTEFNGKEPEKKAESKFKEEPKKVEKEAKAEEVDQELLDALDDAESSFEAAGERYADFNDVISNKDVIITRDMVIAMSDADNAGDIAYHLGKNKDEANRISELSPIGQAKEIGKLEVKLAKKPPAEKRVTSAPDPIEPVGGGDGTEKAEKDMTFSELEAHRNQQEVRSGGSFW